MEFIGEDVYYDMYVPGTENYVAEGIIHHNTGVGKGRILAAVIADNWNQGRRRALWLSVNNDLMPATKRDLTDISSGNIPLARINDYQADTEIELPEGVLFASYSSLISQSKKGAKRLDQIQKWLGCEGVIVLDESSKAKNAIGSGRNDGTQTGQAVIDLQSAKDNPDYRIVYASATGATDVRNMAYMTRLGLWGPGTAFPGGFNEFLNQIEEGGVGAMEMVSRDLKSLGMYLSGSISFGVDPVSGKAVEYRELIHTLTDEQREMYDLAARAWQYVLKNIDEALKVTAAGAKQKSVAKTKFWGSHQRFFCQVITAFKVPAFIKEVERCLAEGKSVVGSLVSTGEARTRDQVGRAIANGEGLEDLDFTPREVISEMIQNGFPTTMHQTVTDPITNRTYQEVATDRHGNPIQSREAMRIKQDLLDGLSALHLPDNPLDQIINHFGPEAVAELTGRSQRLVRDKSGKVTYKKRVPDGVAMARANLYEMEEFQAGRKRIAIISDAASMGISLHASNQCENKQRRVHITLQLGWSADKQMQTFGRTHRSDQAMPPQYVLLSTELGGERRFSSTIAKRLASLGALTKGERLAADSGDLAKYNFETAEGRAALQYFFRSILKGEDVPGLEDSRQTLRDMGLLVVDGNGVEGVRKEDENNIPRFLNRVLALDVVRQNAVFNHFSAIFDRAVVTAKQMGTFDEGVTDIKAQAIRFATQPRIIARDEVTGAQTTHFRLEVDRRIITWSFEQAEQERLQTKGCYLRHLRNGFVVMAAPSGRRTDADTGATHQRFALSRPKGSRTEWRDDQDIERKFVPMAPDDARALWQAEYNALPKIQTTQMHIIGGAILPLWRRLKGEQDSRLKVVRVTTDDGTRIVGASIDPSRVGPVLRAVGVSRDLKSPQEILHAILNEGDRLQLVNGLYLYKRLIHKEPYITLGGPLRYQDYSVLRGMGMRDEYVSGHGTIYFLPTDEIEWPPILSSLLKQYPPLRSREEVAREIDGTDDGDPGAMFAPVTPVDINDLIVPVEIAPVEPEPESLFTVVAEEGETAPESKKKAVRRTRSLQRPAPVDTRPQVCVVAENELPAAPVEYNKRGQGLLF